MDSDSCHKGYVCDGCDGKIRGVLWHCRECGDEPSRSYDLCQQCYNNGEFAKHEEEIGNHHPSNGESKVRHTVVPVQVPAHLLHEASANGNLMTVQWILQQDDSKINMKFKGSTALAKAVISRHSAVVDSLLSHPNIDPNATIFEMSQLPLEYAIDNGDGEMALKLLTHPHVQVNRPSGYITCLHHAARNGMVPVFNALLRRHDADLSAVDGGGVTVLHAACHSGGDLAIVETILGTGVLDVNIQDDAGFTPLLWAVHAERESVVETLLRAGADVGIPNGDGSTPLHAAVCNDNAEITEILLKHLDGSRASFSPLYARDRFGHTPAYYAVAHERPRLARLFLLAGHDVNHKEKDSDRLLHISVRSQDLVMTELLLRHGADTNATNSQYHSPLHFAVQYTVNWKLFHDLVLLFIAHDADLDLKGITNPRLMVHEAALNIALSLNKISIAGLLLRFGCRPNSSKTFGAFDAMYGGDCRDSVPSGEDALTQAFNLREYGLCRMLYVAGADPGPMLEQKSRASSDAAPSAAVANLVDILTNPRRLGDICRLRIRRSMPDLAPESVARLPVPKRLADLLLFSDFADVWKET